MTKALVLGGGGIAGIAWETGVLLGLSDAGLDLARDADCIIGTSAGANVGAQVTSGTPLLELYERHVDGRSAAAEPMTEFDADAMYEELLPLLSDKAPGQQMRAAVGQWALQATTESEVERMRTIDARLPSKEWPGADLRIVAVEAVSGDEVVFTRDSGIPMPLAIAASSAVPGIRPATTINGTKYVDGGVLSSANAHLAVDFDVVLVLQPVDDLAPVPDEVTATLAEMADRMLVIKPDDASREAMGANPLDPTTAVPGAKAGHAQGGDEAARVREFWSRVGG